MEQIDHVSKIRTGVFELMSKSDRSKQKSYNYYVETWKFIKAHIYKEANKEEYTLFIGFSNDDSVFPVDKNAEIHENARSVYHSMETGTIMHLLGYKDADKIESTVIIECSSMPKFQFERYTWDDVMKFPKIRDSSRDVLGKGFIEFHQYEFERESHYEKYFWKEQSIPNVELRLVWNDVDRDEKYGNRTTLILWDGKMIGHVTETSKWLDTHTYFIHNEEEWQDFMKYLHECADKELGEFTPVYDDRPYCIIDPKDSAESWINIPGVTDECYKGE